LLRGKRRRLETPWISYMTFKNGVVVCLAVGTTISYSGFLQGEFNKRCHFANCVTSASASIQTKIFAGKILMRLEGESKGFRPFFLLSLIRSHFTVCWIEVKASFKSMWGVYSPSVSSSWWLNFHSFSPPSSSWGWWGKRWEFNDAPRTNSENPACFVLVCMLEMSDHHIKSRSTRLVTRTKEPNPCASGMVV